MAETEKNPFGEDPGLDLDPNAIEDDNFIEVEDEHGNKIKLKVIFSAVDKRKNAAYVFVDQGEDQVLALATKIDESGNPMQDELEPVGENSPYLDSVMLYLKAYNEGKLTRESQDERVAELIAEEKKVKSK